MSIRGRVVAVARLADAVCPPPPRRTPEERRRTKNRRRARGRFFQVLSEFAPLLVVEGTDQVGEEGERMMAAMRELIQDGDGGPYRHFYDAVCEGRCCLPASLRPEAAKRLYLNFLRPDVCRRVVICLSCGCGYGVRDFNLPADPTAAKFHPTCPACGVANNPETCTWTSNIPEGRYYPDMPGGRA